MKVLLAYKPVDEENDAEKVPTPGGLLAIGAVLRENFIDTELYNFSYASWQSVENKIRELKPDIIGTTCYAFNRHAVFRLAKLAKLVDSATKVVVGGPFATALPERMLRHCPEIDIIVLGEGERTIMQIVKAIQNNTNLEWIEGIAFNAGGKIQVTKPKQFLDLAMLPIPAKYFKYSSVMTSRGCPGQCVFCATPNYWGNKIRFRTTESITKEFILLKKQGVGDLVIADDTFTVNKPRVLDFCSQLVKENLNLMWDCRSRYNFVDKDRLTAMKRAGCYKIGYGIESGSKRILAGLKKFIAPETMAASARLTREAGLYQYAFLIVGSPDEDETSVKETIELLELIKPQAILISYLHAYPGTELYDAAKAKNELGDLNWFKDEAHLPERYIYKFRERKDKLMLFVEKIHEFFRQHKEEWKLKEEELKNNINLCPFDVFSRNELAKIYAKNEDYKTAIEFLNEAAKINPFFPGTFLNLGIIAEKNNRIDEAIDHYKKALQINPQNAVALKNLGNAYLKKENVPKAIVAYENAVLFNYPHKAQLIALIAHLRAG